MMYTDVYRREAGKEMKKLKVSRKYYFAIASTQRFSASFYQKKTTSK